MKRIGVTLGKVEISEILRIVFPDRDGPSASHSGITDSRMEDYNSHFSFEKLARSLPKYALVPMLIQVVEAGNNLDSYNSSWLTPINTSYSGRHLVTRKSQ